jgi:hypothetical protein
MNKKEESAISPDPARIAPLINTSPDSIPKYPTSQKGEQVPEIRPVEIARNEPLFKDPTKAGQQSEPGNSSEPVKERFFQESEPRWKPMKSGGAMGEPPGANGNSRKDNNLRSNEMAAESAAGPIIKISIKQINVRAVSPPSPPVLKQKPRPESRPVLSLEDYLKGRSKTSI